MATTLSDDGALKINDYRTVYNVDYRLNKATFPRKFHHQPEAFENGTVQKVPAREFPDIPQVPHRVVCRDIPIGPGLSTPDMKTWKYLKPKSILKFPPPSKTFFVEPKPSGRRVRFMIPGSEGEWPLVIQPDGERWRTPAAFAHAKSILKSSKEPKTLRDLLKNADWEEENIAHNRLKEELEDEDDGQKLDLFEKLRHYSRWTSSAHRAMHDGLPCAIKSYKEPKTSVYEMRPDEVSLRLPRYASAPERYQAVGPTWDRLQVRPWFGRHSSLDRDNCSALATSWATHITRPERRSSCEELQIVLNIKEMIQENNLARAFQRPFPGYGGFLPRQMIEAKLEKLPSIDNKITVAIETHRPFPQSEYMTRPRYPHRSPLSRTVTLTSPYCPFNKIIPPEPHSRPYQITS